MLYIIYQKGGRKLNVRYKYCKKKNKMKKYLSIVCLLLLIVCLVGCGKQDENKKASTSNDNKTEIKEDSKIAIVYFSASGTTARVAETIADETGGSLIEIVPKEKYTDADLNWNDKNSRTTKECNDKNSRPEIANNIDIDNYDVIYLGYPIWWGDVPHIILTFMDTYNLDGKTVIPFCTSGGTSISGSMNTLKDYNKNVKWINGETLNGSEDNIRSWVKGLNY